MPIYIIYVQAPIFILIIDENNVLIITEKAMTKYPLTDINLRTFNFFLSHQL